MITDYKDIHKDERCFIMGCGPSLNRLDLTNLKNEIVFGVNSVYHIWKKYNHNTIKFKYYCIGDKKVWMREFKVVPLLRTTLFINNGALDLYNDDMRVYTETKIVPLKTNKNNFHIWDDTNIENGVPIMTSVVSSLCIPLAFYMGFKDVYLIGVDCSDNPEKPHWFYGGYREGRRPKAKFDRYFNDYKIIKDVFDRNNRNIYNATDGGDLEIFKRVKLKDVI